MSMMQVSPIHNQQDLDQALFAIAELMENDPAPGTNDGDRLEVLAALVEGYESRHFPISEPDPIEAIRFRMDQMELAVKDLVPLIGEANRVYEVLNKKRPLTLRMIRNLSQKLGIPAHVLIL